MTRPSCSEGVDVTVWINRGVRQFWRGALLFSGPACVARSLPLASNTEGICVTCAATATF